MTSAAFIAKSQATFADPLDALRAALGDVVLALATSGATVADITELAITARVPALLHPARAEADFAYREVFGGARPPLRFVVADHDGTIVEARVQERLPHAAASPSPPVWNGLTAAEIAREYATRAGVQDVPGIFERWRKGGCAFRNTHLAAELAYGPSAEEKLDLYLPAATHTVRRPYPLWVFIHGGFWQALDKAHNAHVAAGMLAAGYAVALPHYTLAPAATLPTIVAQMQRLVQFLGREASALGLDGGQIHLAGHSAGGHLAALMACLPEAPLIRSCLAVSGLFELEPIARLPMGPMLGLDQSGAVATLSPLRHRPHPSVRVGAAVGGAEKAGFVWQTAALATAWPGTPTLTVAGRNHFDLLDSLVDGELLAFARTLALI